MHPRKNTLSLLIIVFLLFGLNICKAQLAGVLDATFNTTGKAFFQVSEGSFGSTPFHRSNTVASNSKRIYVAGSCQGDDYMSAGIVALKPDGTLDPNFGSGGKRIVSSTFNINVADIALQNDEKIVIGGYTQNGFFVIRLNPNGSLDTSWGGNGMVETNMSSGIDMITQLLVQTDGKIVAAGWGGININDAFAVRYNTNGTVDSSFGVDGIFHHDFGGGDRIEGVAQQHDDKLVFAGGGVSNSDGFIIRVTVDGKLDTSFDQDGLLVMPHADFSGVAILPDKKILCSGRTGAYGAVHKFNENGSYDISFGAYGVALTENAQMFACDVIADPSGKIYLPGYLYGDHAIFRDFAVFAFNANGTPSECFGNNGLFRADIGTSNDLTNTTDYCYNGVLQADGKILLTGEAQHFMVNEHNFVVARVTTQGIRIATEHDIHICEGDSFSFGNQILTEAGKYSNIFQDSKGCDSLAVVNLFLAQAQNVSLNESICQGESFIVGDETLTLAGAHSITLQTIHGCDSVVNVNLTVLPSYNHVTTRQICMGATFMFGDEPLTSAGVYEKMFHTIHGCDSLVTLTIAVTEVDNGVTQDGLTLVADEMNANYQWLKAGDVIIPGATNREFTATESGQYAVFVTRDGCAVTSAYNSIIILSVEETLPAGSVSPNPFAETIQLQLPDVKQNSTIQLQDINGRIIQEWYVLKNAEEVLLDTRHVSAGVYILRISTGGSTKMTRLVKRL